MVLTQGQVNELLKFITQHDSMISTVVPELLKDTLSENYVVSYLKRELVRSEEYLGALKLLNAAALDFSKDVLSTHLISFMETVLTNRIGCSNKFRFLGAAIKYCHFNEDVNKSKVLLLIPKIVEKRIAVDRYTSYETESLSCLATCLEHYPSTCGPYRPKLETHLVGYLSYDRTGSAIDAAARCFHYLQQCGSPGIDSINHTQNWADASRKVCLTFKELLECVRDADHAFHHSSDGIVLFPLAVDHSTNDRFCVAEYRLLNLLAYLAALIELKYPCPKVIKPQLIINLLKLCLNKDPARSDSMEAYCSSSVQTHVETRLFYIFRSFVALAGLNLIPFSNAVMKILTDRLHETRGDRYKYNAEYKSGLYKLISYFVKTMKNNVSTEFHKRLLEAIFGDVKPVMENVTLNVLNIRNSSTKTRQKKIESETIGNAGKKDNDAKGNNTMLIREKICCSALDCLKECFRSMTVNIKYNALKHIYKTLCTTLSSVQNGVTTPPYITPVSVCKLYEAIVAALEQVHPPPLQIVLNLLLVGQSSGDNEVSGVCTSGISSIEKICQPVRPLVFSTVTSTSYIEDVVKEAAAATSVMESEPIEKESPHEQIQDGTVEETVANEETANVDVGNLNESDFEPKPDVDEEPVDEVNQKLAKTGSPQLETRSPQSEVNYPRIDINWIRSEVECEPPPAKMSKQAEKEFDDIPLEDMLSSFKDVPTIKL